MVENNASLIPIHFVCIIYNSVDICHIPASAITFSNWESICLVFYHCEAILNLSSSFSLFPVYFCCSAMSFSDTDARNVNGFTVWVFLEAWCSSLLCFFFIFYYFFLNIFICPFHNSENSLFILSCAQETQLVWLPKHKHIPLIYYSNKYWRILAF